MADTYRVNLSVQDAAARIKDEVLGGSVTGELLDFHQVSFNSPQCVVMVFEKYYMRVSNRLTLTVTVDDASGYTRVHAVGGGGGRRRAVPLRLGRGGKLHLGGSARAGGLYRIRRRTVELKQAGAEDAPRHQPHTRRKLARRLPRAAAAGLSRLHSGFALGGAV